MSAGTELEITQGRDASFVLDLARNDLEFDDGDLAAMVFGVKQHHGQTDAEAPLRKTMGAGLSILPDTDPDVVRIRLDLSKDETAGLNPLISYFWDVAVKTADGALSSVDALSGRLIVKPRVSHSTD